MANNPRLQIDIGANIEAFTSAMGTVSSRLNKLSADIGKIGKQMSIGLTAPITAFGAASVAAFDTQAQAEARLRAALQANGRAVNDLFGQYTQFASQLQQISTVGDEATLAMLGTAESMGISGESAKRAVTNALAMESAFGVSAQSAIRMTAALEQGDATLLTRYIPALRQTEDQAERVRMAQDLLGKAFGTVTAQAQTGLGPLTQAKNAFGDLQEQIGAIIAEAINPFLIRAKQLFETLQAQSDETKKRIVLLASAIAGIGPALLVVAGAVKGLAVVFGILSSPITLTIAGIIALGGAIDYLAQNAHVFEAIFTNAWLNIKQAVLQSISDMAGGIANFLSYVPNMEGLSNAFFAIGEQVQMSADSVEEVAVPAFQSFGEYVDSVKTRLGNLAVQARTTAAALLGITSVDQTTDTSIGRSEETVPSLMPVAEPPELKRAEAVEGGLQKIREAIKVTDDAAKQYVSGMIEGFSQMVVQGQKFGDILKDIGKQLLSKGLSMALQALLLGGTGPFSFLAGKGGEGLLGRVLPSIFGAATGASPVMGASPVSGSSVYVTGEFTLNGQDMRLALDRANQFAGG